MNTGNDPVAVQELKALIALVGRGTIIDAWSRMPNEIRRLCEVPYEQQRAFANATLNYIVEHQL